MAVVCTGVTVCVARGDRRGRWRGRRGSGGMRRVGGKLDPHARPALAERDLVAGGEHAPGDALARDERAVSATEVEQHPAFALVAELRVVTAGVAIELGVEDHVVVGRPTEAHAAALDDLYGAGLASERVDHPNAHGAGTPRSRSMRIPTRYGDDPRTLVFCPPTSTSVSSSRCAAWMAMTLPY